MCVLLHDMPACYHSSNLDLDHGTEGAVNEREDTRKVTAILGVMQVMKWCATKH